MIILPAIDLRAGRVVRLKQGRDDAATVYSEDPAQVAVEWQRQGAEWLHVVNLDGAFDENSEPNLTALKQILARVTIPVQLGGGLRKFDAVKSALSLGVSRVVLGTVAIENPALVSEAIEAFGADRIVVGIDARNGLVATRGWTASSHMTAGQLAREMAKRGVIRAVYTEIERDGMLQGIDADAMANLASASGLRVIASGGISELRDLHSLKARAQEGIEGVIIGQALYQGRIALADAIAVGKGNQVAGKENHPLS